MVFLNFQSFYSYATSTREPTVHNFSVTPVMKMVKSLASVYDQYAFAAFIFFSCASLKCPARVSSNAESLSVPPEQL